MSRGRHRRPRTSLISRQFSRLSVVLAAGGAGVAAPLVVAGSAHAVPVAAPVSVAGKTESPSERKPAADSHTVASGDTLYGIATSHGIEGGWKAVYEANRKTVGDDPNLIIPGQKLTLTAPESSGEQSGAPAEQPVTLPAVTKPGGEQNRGAGQLAARSTAAQPASPKPYANNLDGWIREALDIMRANGIPGTYQGIHRNIMRESGGNPNAINNWDINAQRGTPSIGLLQVIKPTFDAYRVPGTANSQYDPVANIVAACNYAADRYGSIDNVYGPY